MVLCTTRLSVHNRPVARPSGGSPSNRGPVTGSRASSGDGLLAHLLELLLPRACVGCGRDGMAWCSDCLGVEFDPVLHRPDPCPPGLPRLAASASYSGSVRCAILAAKERDRRELDRLLGAMLAAAIGQLLSSGPTRPGDDGPLWLVPVPASPAALRERGRDHVSDWTRWALRSLRAIQVRARRVPVLRRSSGGQDSVGLDARQRAANLRGAFAVGRIGAPPRGTRVVIVDDIVTTGATLVAASTCLTDRFDLDPQRICAAVVAATQRRPARDRD